MFKDTASELRHIVASSMVGDSPLARALLTVADGAEQQRAGLAAVVERLERLEEEQQASLPDPVTGGVHSLGPYVPGTAL